MTAATGYTVSNPPKRKVTLALASGVLFLPAIFIWFLFRRGYSAKAQIIACAWMGAVGTALLLGAPNGPLTGSTPKKQTATVAPPSRIVTTILDAPGGSPLLAVKVGETQAVQRLLRTRVTLTNNTGADLKYAEVLCVFYSADGKLLGNGLGTWPGVAAGQVRSGDVIASNIELAQVASRQCRARSQRV